MIATRKRTRKQINDLKMDLEVINPIESKTLLGGNWYEQLDTVYVYSHGWASGAGDFGGTYDPFYDGSSTNDWYNYGENYGGSGGSDGGLYTYSDHLLNYADNDFTNNQNNSDVESNIRNAAGIIGLGVAFTGTALDGLTAVMSELGFTPSKAVSFGKGFGIASVVIGGSEVFMAAYDASTGVDPWTDTDTLNAISTVFGTAALIPGPHSIICGGISIAVGLVGQAYSSNNP